MPKPLKVPPNPRSVYGDRIWETPTLVEPETANQNAKLRFVLNIDYYR